MLRYLLAFLAPLKNFFASLLARGVRIFRATRYLYLRGCWKSSRLS
jgi:hypothetical protein